MIKRPICPDENHGFYKQRDYYKGKSFNWIGDWKEKTQYFNDEYVTDFIGLDGVMLACKKTHMSTVNNKPKLIYVSDEDGYSYKLQSEEFWTIASYKGTGHYTQLLEQPIHYGNDEPKNKEALWISKQNGTEYGNSDPIINNIYNQLGYMQEQLALCMRIIRYGINAGDATVGGRTIMMQTSDIAINPTTGDEEPTDADKPDEFKYTVPNIAIKRDKASKFKNNLNNLINGELIWIEAEDSTSVDPGLHIWLNGAFVSIGSGSGIIDDENMTETQLKKMMSSIYFDDLGLTDGYGNNYSVKINGDGNIIVYNDDNPYLNEDGSLNLGTRDTDTGGSYISDFLRIQSVFLGGNLTPDVLPAATHSFVELGNTDSKDINLNGLVLLYRSGFGVPWIPLYLKGIIPSGKTFLIRGKQCGKPSNICVNVDSYDMEWRDSNGELIGFNENGATFYLTVLNSEGKIYDREVKDWVEIKNFTSKTPYNKDESDPKGYIDLVGIGKNEFAEGNAIDAEKNLIIKSIFFRKNAMDPGRSTSVIKVWAKRSTTTFWDYCIINKESVDGFPYYSDKFKKKLAPKASYVGKGFYDKRTSFVENEPNCVNVTFGRKATTNTNDAVRCFNWISCGYYDEFVQYKLEGSDTWINVSSISDKSKSEYYSTDPSVQKYFNLYNRYCWVTSAGNTVTTHKAIIRNLSQGYYEYRIVRFDENGDIVYSSPIKQFSVFSDDGDFTFVQVTDQQGFNYEEYSAWEKSAHCLSKDTYAASVEFTINTGDMTQSGSRENEWVDYFSGRKPLEHLVEMPCIGNNDLCAIDLFKLDKGGGSDKLNSQSIWLFYTFDLNESNSPIFKYIHNGVLDENKYSRLILKKEIIGEGLEQKSCFEYFMPSIYSFVYKNYQFIALNSEFMTNASQSIYHPNLDEGIFRANAYYNEYKWLEKEHTKNKQTVIFCHEIPVCIIAAKTGEINQREIGKSSRLNTDLSYGVETTEWVDVDDKKKYENGFSFTEYFQKNKIKLCIGGHKHTYSLTYPVKENIVVDENGNRTVKPQELIVYGAYQNEKGEPMINYDDIDPNEESTVYIMCQATGYKLTSNKDIPQENTPWMYKYFACTRNDAGEAKVNPGQQYPMYNIFECNYNEIVLTPRNIKGIWNDGTSVKTYLINQQNNAESINTLESGTYTIKLPTL